MSGLGVSRRPPARLLGPGFSWIALTYVVPTILVLVYSFLTPRLGGGVIWDFSLDAWREVLGRGQRSEFSAGTVGAAALRGLTASVVAAVPLIGFARFLGRHVSRGVLGAGVLGILVALNHLAGEYNNYSRVFARSIVWALLATILCAVLALPIAVFIRSRRTQVSKNTLLVAVMIPFWTSMLVRTYAIRFLLANTGPLNNALESLGLDRQVFLNTRFAVMVGLVYTALPFMILPLYAAVERADQAQVEAARDLGAHPVQVFFDVFIPTIKAGLSVGSVMVFVLSVSQFLVPVLLGGGKTNMISNLLELQFGESFNWPLGAAIAVIFSGLTIATLYFVIGRSDEVELL